MAACPDVLVVPGVLVRSVLLLVLSSNPVLGNYTMLARESAANDTTGPNIAAIVAPTVTLGVLAVVLAVLGWLLCVVKKRRQTEGTYRPSAEEQSGESSAERGRMRLHRVGPDGDDALCLERMNARKILEV